MFFFKYIAHSRNGYENLCHLIQFPYLLLSLQMKQIVPLKTGPRSYEMRVEKGNQSWGVNSMAKKSVPCNCSLQENLHKCLCIENLWSVTLPTHQLPSVLVSLPPAAQHQISHCAAHMGTCVMWAPPSLVAAQRQDTDCFWTTRNFAFTYITEPRLVEWHYCDWRHCFHAQAHQLTLARSGGGVDATPPPWVFLSWTPHRLEDRAEIFHSLWGILCATFGEKNLVRSGQVTKLWRH